MIARLKFLIPLILFSFGLHAQNSLKECSLIVDSLYSVFNELGKPGCAIAIVKEGRVVYQKCFGLSDLEHQLPITSSTLFGLASVSKQFTGFGIAKLVKDQRLNLNFEIDKYLQNENMLWSSIQLRNLVHHTSGIWEWPYLFLATGHTFNDVITHQYIYKIIKSQSEVNFLTGSEFQYGSSNYVLLGQIISNVTDTCYFDWVKQNVFKQVGMSETTFQTSHSDLINNRAYGYLYENNKYSRTTDNISPQGTGSIYSNLTDMTSWTKYILSEYTKKNPIIIQMLETDTLNNGKSVPYAFGLMKRNTDCYWHDGVFQGLRNITILYPEHHVGLVLLSNSGSNYILRSAFTIAEMFVKDSIPKEQIHYYKKRFSEENISLEENTKFVYRQSLNDYKGIFLNTELLITYRIFEQNDSLFVENSIERILLTPIEAESDKFNSSKLLLGDFAFKRNENGKVIEFFLEQKRNNSIRFIKIDDN